MATVSKEVIRQIVNERYAIYNDDCIQVSRTLPDESVGFSVYSPPFAQADGGLYKYSSSDHDLSNSRNYGEFLEHYGFVVDEIHRTTMKGRCTAVHCMDTPLSNSGRSDFIMDFPGDIYEMHVRCVDPNCTASPIEKKHGLCGHGRFGLKARFHIWKEPLGVRNRTMAKKLAHQTIVEDSAQCGNAGADYLLVFQKKGTNPEPIVHPHGLTYYAGETQMPSDVLRYKNWPGKQIENKFSHWIWRNYASSNWYDVRIDNVLPYRDCKEQDDEKHVHPLQLDVIERALVLFSNPGDIVWTPFMGVGSEVFGAVKLGRRGVGAELKSSYFRQAVANLEQVEAMDAQPTMLPGFG
jgi:DNA modification methylase